MQKQNHSPQTTVHPVVTIGFWLLLMLLIIHGEFFVIPILYIFYWVAAIFYKATLKAETLKIIEAFSGGQKPDSQTASPKPFVRTQTDPNVVQHHPNNTTTPPHQNGHVFASPEDTLVADSNALQKTVLILALIIGAAAIGYFYIVIPQITPLSLDTESPQNPFVKN